MADENDKFLNPEEYNTIHIGGEADESENNRKTLSNLISLLTDANKKELKEDALKLLKEKGGIELLIAAIKNVDLKEHKCKLIAACWEAGIDGSPYITMFVDLAIKEDYLTSLEALTVIENMEGPFAENVLKECQAKIEKALQSEQSEKQGLIKGLLEVVEYFEKMSND